MSYKTFEKIWIKQYLLIRYCLLFLSCFIAIQVNAKSVKPEISVSTDYRISWPYDRPTRAPNKMALAERSDLVAIAGKRYGLHLYSISTRNLINQFIDPDDAEYKKDYPTDRGIYALTFTPDESQLISGDEASQINIWDVKQGLLVHRFNAMAGRINTLAISSDGNYLAVGSEQGKIQLWNLVTYKKVFDYPGLVNKKFNRILPIKGVVFIPNKKQLIVSVGGIIYRWSYEENVELTRLRDQLLSSNYQIKISSKGQYLYSEDIIWDSVNGLVVLNINKSGQDENFITTSYISANEKQFVTRSSDGVITVREIKTGEIKYKTKFDRGVSSIGEMLLRSDNRSLVLLDSTGRTVSFWDLKTGVELLPSKPVLKRFKSIMDKSPQSGPYALSQDGQILVMGLSIRNANTLEVKNEIEIANLYVGGIRDVALSSDSKLYAACVNTKEDFYVGIWDLNSGQRTQKIISNCLSVDFSLTSNAIFVVDQDLLIHKLDTNSGASVFTINKYERILTGTEDVPRSVDLIVSRNKFYLAINTKFKNGYIAVHNLKTGKLTRLIEDENIKLINQMAISPDGQYLAITTKKSSNDQPEIVVYMTATGKKILNFIKQANCCDALAFSVTKQKLYAAFKNFELKSWSMPAGKPDQPIRFGWGKESGVKNLLFSPDGKRLYLGGQVWDVWSNRELNLHTNNAE